MIGCPIAYADPCSSCPQYGNCAPSEAVKKLEYLESAVYELKEIISQMQNQSFNNNE